MKYDLSFLEVDLRELLKKLKKHNTYASQLENEIILYKLEIERLHSIIKEVREKIKSVNISYLGMRSGKIFTIKLLLDILEILDKEKE